MPPRPPVLRFLARLSVTAVVVALAGLTPAPAAHGTPSWQAVAYGAERFAVPPGWPIDHLDADPSLCVRFDRHAVYEGAAGATPSCPPQAVGVTEAVQIQPLDAAGRAQAGPDLRSATIGAQPALVNTDRLVTQRLIAEFPDAGVLVTISYGQDPAVARRILASFHATTGSSRVPTTTVAPVAAGAPSGSGAAKGKPSPSTKAPVSNPAGTSGPVSVGPIVWHGEAFDACSAPSSAALSAWRVGSPYRAVGVYIGGVNRACGDGDLSSSWVDTEVEAGWDLLPIYVGLQASCADQAALASIVATSAASEGRQAADDAAAQAAYFGIGLGSPILLDMEAWNTADTSCSAAVVTFVRAWDNELMHDRFLPGIYGSADSGIAQDIAPLYAETHSPRLVDIADWDGQANTNSPYVAAKYWPDHQRLKQYEGDVTETYGGFSIQIDEDYVDSTVVGNEEPDVTSISPASGAVGTTVTIRGRAFVAGRTTVQFGGVDAAVVAVSSSGQLTARVPAHSIHAVNVTVTSPGGTTGTSPTDRFTYIPIIGEAADASTAGYWLTTGRGNIYPFHAPWQGSSAAIRLPAPVVGVGDDARRGGYWLVTSVGNVYNFNAPWYGSMAGKLLPAPVVGVAADARTGGYWLVTAAGNVYNFHAPAYGSAPPGGASVTAIAADAATGGYWLATSAGNVYNFHAPWYGSGPRRPAAAPVTGVAADAVTGGYWLVTSKGAVYNFHAPWYGSRTGQESPAPVNSITAAGPGYLLGTAAGNVYNFATTFYGSPAA